ncbi:MAG: tail fiber domain-containing protein [Pseudolabrys sp.]|jgi:hypothetical protein
MSGEDSQTTSQSQQSSTEPWAKAQPLLTNLISKYQGLNTDVTSGQKSALDTLQAGAGAVPTDLGSQSTGAINNLFSSSTTPQVGMLSSALGGLKSNLASAADPNNINPYNTPGFSDAMNTATSDAMKAIKGVYAGSGRDPSGAGSFAGSAARGVLQATAPILQAQFNTNRANQQGAAQSLYSGETGTAGAITGQEQIPLANQLQAIQAAPTAASNYTVPGQLQTSAANAAYSQPWANLAQLLQAGTSLGGMGSQSTGTGTSTTTQPQSTLSNIMGAAAGGTGILSQMGAFGPAGFLALSDERAKDDIEPIGKLNDGQDVVRFRYKGENNTRIGLLAQDVAKHEPSAVHKIGGRVGLLAVNHRRATDRAAAMGRAA